jgi:hypothetical protein
VGDPVGHRPRLARARTSQDPDRAGQGLRDLALLRVEITVEGREEVRGRAGGGHVGMVA